MKDLVYRLLKEVLSKEGKVAGFVETRVLSKEGAVAARQAEKNVVVKAKTLSKADKAAAEVESTAYPAGKQVNHPAGAHGNSTGHYQTKNVDGHTFYKTLAVLAIGLVTSWEVDAAMAIAQPAANAANEKLDSTIDNMRRNSNIGGEKRGEKAADEIINGN